MFPNYLYSKLLANQTTNKEMSKNNVIMPQKYPMHKPNRRKYASVSVLINDGARHIEKRPNRADIWLKGQDLGHNPLQLPLES